MKSSSFCYTVLAALLGGVIGTILVMLSVLTVCYDYKPVWDCNPHGGVAVLMLALIPTLCSIIFVIIYRIILKNK